MLADFVIDSGLEPVAGYGHFPYVKMLAFEWLVVLVLAIGASLVVEGAFALSAMMDGQERRKERYRKKMTTQTINE